MHTGVAVVEGSAGKGGGERENLVKGLYMHETRA